MVYIGDYERSNTPTKLVTTTIMTTKLQTFFNVVVGLTSPYGLHGAIIKKDDEIQGGLSIVSTLLWVAELSFLISAYVISSNIASMSFDDEYATATTLAFIRMVFVAVFVILNVLAGFDIKISISYAASVFLSILEIGTSVLPIISLGMMQDDLAKTNNVNVNNVDVEMLIKDCSSGIPEGNPFSDSAAIDTQLSYIHTFVVISLFVRLIRNYGITAASGDTSIGFEPSGENMSDWQKRKLKYNEIRKSAKEEVTYNFTNANGITRHDLF